MLCITLLLCLFIVTAATDIVTLDSSNFEAKTQASTGATTGDWLIKFYAPWCGHCKQMQPAYEETATALKGEVNVAEVNVDSERQLGSRFGVRGFPTLLFLRQGKVIKYKGPRTKDALTEFAQGGYNDAKYQEDAEEVPGEMGYFGEVTAVFKQSYKAAVKDISQGEYITMNILTCVMPVMFLLLAVILFLIPIDDEPVKPRRVPQPAKADKAD